MKIIHATTGKSRRALLAQLSALGGLSLVNGVWSRNAGAGCSAETPILKDGFEAAARATAGSCVLIPTETQGPYPLLSVLANSAMQRQDITEGRPGLPLIYRLRVVNLNDNCAPVANAGVYIWQCDRDGVYSGYSQPGANTVGQTFCRGIQFTDCNGEVQFLAMYPGWYNGRITHTHFQIYLNLQGTVTATSQLAFPQDVTQAVYATANYPRGQNTSVTSFQNDNVFADGVSNQLATLVGSVSSGYEASLTIGVAL